MRNVDLAALREEFEADAGRRFIKQSAIAEMMGKLFTLHCDLFPQDFFVSGSAAFDGLKHGSILTFVVLTPDINNPYLDEKFYQKLIEMGFNKAFDQDYSLNITGIQLLDQASADSIRRDCKQYQCCVKNDDEALLNFRVIVLNDPYSFYFLNKVKQLVLKYNIPIIAGGVDYEEFTRVYVNSSMGCKHDLF